MVNFKKLEKTSQDPSQVVLAPKLPKDFGRLSISMDLETMYARYRACVGTRNKVWFSFRGKNMLITGMRRVTEDEERRLAAYKNA
jgi:methionyl-tRNA formyltransferase